MSKFNVPEILERGARTYRQRNAIYGDSWETFRNVMALLFPNGLDLTDPDNILIYNLLSHLVGKVVRFTNSKFKNTDSVHDISVYAAMIEAYVLAGGKKKLDRKGKRSVKG
jgi:hypothetical protein